MLTSSDAKWRCMWHMLVWSVLLTMASQYLSIVNHIALYIFAGTCMIFLPAITAIYSNTSGRHGSGLIRVGYVICDPVLACITITPVLILNHLPSVVNRHNCLVKYDVWNVTCDCVMNRSYGDHHWCSHGPEKDSHERQLLRNEAVSQFIAIQFSVAAPILLSLLMGRRTRKMGRNTCILTFGYWFVTAIELVDMIETIRLGDIYKNVIYTTGAVITITMIITNSYAVVTLCSFISPRAGRGDKQTNRFDLVYRIFVGASAVLFTEIPLLVARFQMLSADASRILPATFYLWCIKDFLFLCLIIFILFSQKFCKKNVIKLPCKVKFDNTDIIFQPEKRDEYIVSKKTVTFQDPPATTFGETLPKISVVKDSVLDRSTVDVTKKTPSSVLKNSTAGNSINPTLLLPTSRIDRGSTGQLTDLSSRKTSRSSSEASVEVGAKLTEQYRNANTICFPLTDLSSMSSSCSSSPKVSSVVGGARPKIMANIGIHSNQEIKEIKSRPSNSHYSSNYSSSDTDSLV